ncbi:hypothetical protein ACQPZA_05120 [Pseudonocardia xinjiangensis]|uniref:hypothetical protein n=1 Tax=Pseudonocardia xinjiangensis TaxID=75289 RepID=UPI003D937EA9
MSGVHLQPQFGPPDAAPGVPRLIAAGLLVVSAALAVGGSFLALSVRRYEFSLSGPTVVVTTAWGVGIDPPPEAPTSVAAAAPLGIPLVVAAGAAVVAAILLLLSARRPGDHVPARMLGVVSAGLLGGSIWIIWIELTTQASNARAAAEGGIDSGFRPTVGYGPGAWLLLGAAMVALVAVPLLMVRPDDPPTGPPAGPYGPWPQFPPPSGDPRSGGPGPWWPPRQGDPPRQG